MPTNPSDPNSPNRPKRYYETDEPPKSGGGGGGIILVVLLLLVLGGGAAYYFLIYKPAADAGGLGGTPTTLATPKPTPKPTATPGASPYGNTQRKQYVDQAEKAFLALRGAKLDAFTTAYTAFNTAGGIRPVGLTSKDAIAARRNLIAQCQIANDDYEAFIKTQEATFKAELKKTPLVADDVDYVSNDFAAKSNTDKIIQLRDAQRESLKTSDDILAFFDKTFGGWSAPGGKLTFRKPADSNEYNTLAQKYSAQVTALQDLRKQINSAIDTAPEGSPEASPAGSPSVSPAASLSASPSASPSVSPSAAPSVSPTVTPAPSAAH